MRTIKFRAWIPDRKIMGEVLKITFGRENNPKALLHPKVGIDWECGAILMQFTSLHDKNGKEIFEGDILGRVYEWMPQIRFVNEVVFVHGQFGLKPHPGSTDNIHNGVLACGIQEHVVEILGNIYTTPELLT